MDLVSLHCIIFVHTNGLSFFHAVCIRNIVLKSLYPFSGFYRALGLEYVHYAVIKVKALALI